MQNNKWKKTIKKGNIENNKSISNGICSANVKNIKHGRKNSHHSNQEYDKKPLNNNSEHFDGIDQIIANVNASSGTLKSKKSNLSAKERKKLHGSLPNHLDSDADGSGDDTNKSGKWNEFEHSEIVCAPLWEPILSSRSLHQHKNGNFLKPNNFYLGVLVAFILDKSNILYIIKVKTANIIAD